MLKVGETLNESIRLQRLVGRGELGEVFEANCDDRGEKVAVKVFHADLLGSGVDFTGYQMTLEMICCAPDTPVMQVLDFGEHEDGRPFMVMGWIPGGNLEAFISRQKRLPLARVTVLLEQIAAALDHLGGHGAIHGDLKPGHVMARREAGEVLQVKLLGMGLRSLYPAAGEGSRRVHPYMAPEVIEASGMVTGAVDVYGMGALATLALTGQPPFSGKAAELGEQICQQEPATITAIFPELTAVAEVIGRAMARAPEDRYETPGEMVRAFAEAVKAAPAPRPREAPRSAPPPSTGEGSGWVRPRDPTSRPGRRGTSPAPASRDPSPKPPPVSAAPAPPRTLTPAPVKPAPARTPAPVPEEPVAPPEPPPEADMPAASTGDDLLGGQTLLDAAPSRKTPSAEAEPLGGEAPKDAPVGHTVLADDELSAELFDGGAPPKTPDTEAAGERSTVILPDGAKEPGGEHDTVIQTDGAVDPGCERSTVILQDGAPESSGAAPRETVVAPHGVDQPVARPSPTPREPAGGPDHVTVLAPDAVDGDGRQDTPTREEAVSAPAPKPAELEPTPAEPEPTGGLSLLAIAALAAGAATLAIVAYMLLQ